MPYDYGYDRPDYWTEAVSTDAESFLNSDFCAIQKQHYFVRGLIEIPIVGSDQSFRWGVWSSLSNANFDRITKLWHDPQLLNEPPYFGWISNSIGFYPQTLNLKANVRSRTLNERPYITLEPTDHPLSIDQRNGMTQERVREIVERVMHG